MILSLYGNETFPVTLTIEIWITICMNWLNKKNVFTRFLTFTTVYLRERNGTTSRSHITRDAEAVLQASRFRIRGWDSYYYF